MSNLLIPIIVAVVGGLVTVVFGPVLKAWFDRRRQARDLEARYRGALLRSAYELQNRLLNISEWRMLHRRQALDEVTPEAQGYVHTSTLWLIGQYLAWVELLRRDAQFLALGTTARGRQMLRLVDDVSGTFASDEFEGRTFRLFRAQQSALAEMMIIERDTSGEVRYDCIGYATFTRRLEDSNDPVFARWFGPLIRDLEAVESGPEISRRIVEIQHALIHLVQFLSENEGVRIKLLRWIGQPSSGGPPTRA